MAPVGALNPGEVSGPVGQRLTIPTHVSPSGGQTTHPSVLYVADGWNGYRYWMAHTPYPGGDDEHEDPNICASPDGINWTVPDGLVNPLDDQPGSPGALNSDVDLRMGPSDTMFLFWRTYDPAATGAEEKLYYRTSTDGITWAAKTLFYQADQTQFRPLSPSLLYEDGRWIMWCVDVTNSPNRVMRLDGGATPTTGWSAPAAVDVGEMQTGKNPWHIAIIKDDGWYVGLLNDALTGQSGISGDLLFIASEDGYTFDNSAHTVIPRVQTGEHTGLYRATLIPDNQSGVDGYRVWYAGWIQGPPHIWNIYRTFITAPAPPPPPEPEPEVPPTIGVAELRTEVQWLGCDLVTGRVVADLPDITGAVSRVLGAATSSSLELPIPLAGPAALGDLAFQATAPGQTMIVAVVNGVPTWGGIVLVREGGSDPTLRLGCISLDGYLDRRYVADHEWVQRDAASAIAAGLIGDANLEGIGLEVDAPHSGIVLDREYMDKDDATVYRRLGELMKITGGPEWTIDLDWADAHRQVVRKIIRVRARIGAASPSPNAVFSTRGGSNTRYTYKEDYSDGRGANHIIATSTGEGEDRPQSTPAVDIQPGWARYERRFSPSTAISDKAVLDGHATADLGRRLWGARTWQLETRWDASPRLNLEWRLGDDVAWDLVGHRHPNGVTGVGRVIGWELDMRAGIVKPILWQPEDETGVAQ